MRDRSDVVLDRSPAAAPDLLSEVLAATGARAAKPSQLAAGGRWALRFHGYRQAKVITVARGSCWLRPERGTPVRLGPGDSYLLTGGGPYVAASDVDAVPEEGTAVFARAGRGGAHCGVGVHETGLLGGDFDFGDTPAAALLVASLPAGIRIDAPTPAGQVLGSSLRLLAAEHLIDRPGAEAMRWHLTQIIYLQVLRLLLSPAPGAGGALPGWLAALRDPEIAAALVLIHDQPVRPWTVAALAAEVGLSRTVFATRFKALVGLAPMDYLRHRRIDGAARELADGRRTVAAVATRWGYGSESAFSAAFKRVQGHPPGRRKL